MYNDERWMSRCLELASMAKANGKTAVGALIIKNDEIVAEGFESSVEYPALVAHAEIVALLKAVDILGTRDLSDCIMYSTVEPCFMCSYLIRETKIATLVFGVSAGQIGGSNPDFPLLATDKIARWPNQLMVRSGVMEKECRELLKREQG